MTSRRSHRWILGVLIILLIGAILFFPSYGWKLRQILSPGGAYGTGQGSAAIAATGSATSTDAINLAAENDVLKSQIALYQTIMAELPQDQSEGIRAMVYSRYPLNFKNEILVNAGSADGVTNGAAVTFEGMLIGRVIQLFPHEALVQTVFDSGFDIPVRVSTSSYDGLLQGGADPNVGSIAQSADIQAGDVVYSAASGLPYGLPIGEVNATSTSPDSLFTVATIVFPYDINAIQTVLIANGS